MILLSAPCVVEVLGHPGLMTLERLMGMMILVMLPVQMLPDGIAS